MERHLCPSPAQQCLINTPPAYPQGAARPMAHRVEVVTGSPLEDHPLAVGRG